MKGIKRGPSLSRTSQEDLQQVLYQGVAVAEIPLMVNNDSLRNYGGLPGLSNKVLHLPELTRSPPTGTLSGCGSN